MNELKEQRLGEAILRYHDLTLKIGQIEAQAKKVYDEAANNSWVRYAQEKGPVANLLLNGINLLPQAWGSLRRYLAMRNARKHYPQQQALYEDIAAQLSERDGEYQLEGSPLCLGVVPDGSAQYLCNMSYRAMRHTFRFSRKFDEAIVLSYNDKKPDTIQITSGQMPEINTPFFRGPSSMDLLDPEEYARREIADLNEAVLLEPFTHFRVGRDQVVILNIYGSSLSYGRN